jgi:hypothetical protein
MAVARQKKKRGLPPRAMVILDFQIKPKQQVDMELRSGSRQSGRLTADRSIQHATFVTQK